MADDDAGDWFGASDDGPPPESSFLKKKVEEEPAGQEEIIEEIIEEVIEEERPEAEPELDPDRLILFKHWIRPRFLQYNYLYDYRKNYYNDVIEYLDKRQKGFQRDIPRPQTWAERALRTYNSKICKMNYFKDLKEDTKLCTKIRLGSLFHIYHSKEYFNRRYASLI